MAWQCGSFTLDCDRPHVMGIVNVTPDSFSDGGAHQAHAEACAHARRLLAEGAEIIDVGGESTRPGARPVPPSEELARVLPVVQALAQEGVCVSVDTRHAETARACVEAGAAIINDVSGFRDRGMREVAAACEAGLVVMHMQGQPANMQANPHYDDVVGQVHAWLARRAEELEKVGVAPDRICLDPGIGFGKRQEDNLALLRATGDLVERGYPVMVAVSRKGFIGAITGVDRPAGRVAGSVATACYAVERGARIVRAHDVAPTVQALRMLQALCWGS